MNKISLFILLLTLLTSILSLTPSLNHHHASDLRLDTHFQTHPNHHQTPIDLSLEFNNL